MEQLKEALFSGSFLAWAIVVVLFILFLKLVHAAGKGLVIVLIVIAVGIALFRTFPELASPLVDFVQGGWLGNND